MKLAAIIAIAIVLTGGGVAGYYVYTGHVTGTTDTTDTTPTDSTQIEPTTYTGAEVLNYNSNAAQNPSAYDGIDAIYKGKSGTVMVFQIAEIKNCVYALIDHTGGDGNVKQLSFSESTSIGQSFTETTEKAVAYTTGSEKSHGTDYSNSIALGAEVGGGNIFVSVKGSITYTWQTGVNDTNTIINSKETTETHARSVENNTSKTTEHGKVVTIETEKGKNYYWAFTTTAYVYELVNFKHDPVSDKYVFDSPSILVSYDLNDMNDYVYVVNQGEKFDYKYVSDQEMCILTDKQLNAAVSLFNQNLTCFTITFYDYDYDEEELSILSSAEYVEGAAVIIPDCPEKETYLAKGWALSQGSNTSIDVDAYAERNRAYYPVYEDLFVGYTRIKDVNGLRSIEEDMNGNYVLVRDIVINELTVQDNVESFLTPGTKVQWAPLGQTAHKFFSGKFDGNGHTITGLAITNNSPEIYDIHDVLGVNINYDYSGTSTGLFWVLHSTAIVSNIVFHHPEIYSSTQGKYEVMSVGVVSGISLGATIKGVKVLNGSVQSVNSGKVHPLVGGIIGVATSGTTITDCINENTIVNSYGAGCTCGGILGAASERVSIKYCVNAADVSSYGYADGSLTWTWRYTDAGGIVGTTSGSNNANNLIDHCFNKGKITATGNNNTRVHYDAAGIVGRNASNKDLTAITNCMYVSGKYYEDGTKQTDRITDGGSGNLAQTNTNRIVNGDNIGNLTNWIDTTITDLRYSYQKESFYLEWQDLS